MPTISVPAADVEASAPPAASIDPDYIAKISAPVSPLTPLDIPLEPALDYRAGSAQVPLLDSGHGEAAAAGGYGGEGAQPRIYHWPSRLSKLAEAAVAQDGSARAAGFSNQSKPKAPGKKVGPGLSAGVTLQSSCLPVAVRRGAVMYRTCSARCAL